MQLRNLITFIHVAELGSFTKAAEALDYSQSTISFQIKQLEEELGCLLFERINHTITLTERGHDLISYAHQVRALIDDFKESLTKEEDCNGHIHIVTPDSVCEKIIYSHYIDFHQRYPSISLKITNADTSVMFDMLDHNEADAIITLDSHSYRKDYVIAKEEPLSMHFVTNIKSKFAGKRSLQMKDIANEPFILTEHGQGYRRVLDIELAKKSLEITPVLEIGRTDIPLLPGADREEDPRSDAARFIVETVSARPGEITLVAIGSMTNLYGAWLLDNTIFHKVKEIVIMGGYTAPVYYHTRHLEELNFSVNPEAAACVLNHGKNISILTGNNTLEPSYLPKEEFIEKLCSGSGSGRYIAEKCGYRFDDKALQDGDAASYCWDVVATVYLLHPELFTDVTAHCFVTKNGMYSGWLGVTEPAADTAVLNLPVVKDLVSYREEMYSGWLNFHLEESK